MLEYFSKIDIAVGAATPAVDFDGVWKNELDSEMDLQVDASGNVTGAYRTGVGAPGKTESFSLVGFASGDLLTLTVNFGKYGSLTSWVGQHTEEKGQRVIKCMWLLASNVEDTEEPKKLWGAVMTGYNNFHR